MPVARRDQEVMLPRARFTDARLDPAFLCSRILRTHHQMTMATAHAGGRPQGRGRSRFLYPSVDLSGADAFHNRSPHNKK
jgi:hypothetical protein